MKEYTTNQPIGSTQSNEPIFGKNAILCNGTCKGKSAISTCPLHCIFVDNTACEHCGHINGYHLENCANDTKTLTPLGEALQANCHRCNMRWIVHNCPQYPKLLDAKEMIKKLARGAVLQELVENADYFTSIKQDGEEFNVYIRENNKITP